VKRLLKCCLGFVVVMAAGGHEFTDEQKAWWAVQPVKTVVVPEGVGHPVDYFVERKLEEVGLKMAPGASAVEFVRRAYFDLHGLPPTVEAVRKFVVAWDEDEDTAVAGLVEELLASPRYGERWGQHWLDVVRYADSDGYRADDFRSSAFRYRDYVIRAFNEDKPYDEFVREQLAGDEIAPGDPMRVAATGFLRNGVYEWNQRNAEMQREIMINEITNVTGEVFMGMGVGCAQCHDHKFDPILQKDYFALQAFLSSVYWPDDRYHATEEEISKYEKDSRTWDETTEGIRDEMKSLLEAGARKTYEFRVKTFPPEVQVMFRKPWEEKSAYERQISFLVERQAEREVRTLATAEKILKKGSAELQRYGALKEEMAFFENLKPEDLPRAFVSTDTGREGAVVRMKEEEVSPGFLELLGGEVPEIEVREGTSGRRSALAEWLVRGDHPTTARVMVNRIWQHHFGKGIAASPNDFGMLGEEPSHPELLDWLAGEFVKGGWKMKQMHRLIMTSAAYRQTARFEPSNVHEVIDPENKWLWRFSPKRLSAEQIRDAMLAVSGELRHRDGGAAQTSAVPVRSIYVKKMRNTPDRILQCFDSPSGFSSEPERLNTTTATQSLLLANSEWPLARARAMAGRILGGKENPSAEDVAKAYRTAWGREASDVEVKAAVDFLAMQKTLTGEVLEKETIPKMSGLIALGDLFKGAEPFLPQGAKGAISLNPGSGRERLELPGVELKDDHFTVSAVARLEGIHADARVNTLVSQWNGNQESSGWAMGVTSAKSQYSPRNFIMQLVGHNPDGDLEYEVVASGLQVPLNIPVFMAVTVDPQPNGEGKVTFYLKDLSMPGAQMQRVEVSHHISGVIRSKGENILVGGRNGEAHLWHGTVARLTVIPEVLGEGDLMKVDDPLVDLVVSDITKPPSEIRWLGGNKAPKKKSPTREAFADFCHALLSSNEFLYLH
jgi:hypothetical protein